MINSRFYRKMSLNAAFILFLGFPAFGLHLQAEGNAPAGLRVTREQVSKLGIKIAKAETGTIQKEISVPGELKIDGNRVAHIVPPATGFVRKVDVHLGDSLEAGAGLATIESAELADAKLTFYSKLSDLRLAQIKVLRTREVFENVVRLLDLLKISSDDAEIQKLDNLKMGSYRQKLIIAYAEYHEAMAIHERETQLRQKKVSSGQDYLTASTNLNQGRAKYLAILDTARYETWAAYEQANQNLHLASFNAIAAETDLRLKGADNEIIKKLQALVPVTDELKRCYGKCGGCPTCKMPVVHRLLDEVKDIAMYSLCTPVNGILVGKEVDLGASVDTSSILFTVADLSSIWVDLAVSQNNIPNVRKGYPVTIYMPDGSSCESKIAFVSPIVATETRTTMARAILDNPEGKYRPGTFIEAVVKVPSTREAVLIPEASIQLVYDHPCVFVWNRGSFELREVKTGSADKGNIEIVSGLKAGEKVAAVNAFHLKAEFIKTAAGDLGSGHGHPH